jgi:hypothetical protein
VLGDIDRGATVLAAQGQSLQQPQSNQQDRCDDAGGCERGQYADQERAQAHAGDGDDEGVLSADQITDVPEYQGAERTHCEAGGERQQREDEGRARFHPGEELLCQDGGERAVDVEVVPLENRSDRRGQNHFSFLGRHLVGLGQRLAHCRRHVVFPRR